MSLQRTMPADLIETALSLIVPFILPTTREVQAARETAWLMLGEYDVGSTKEFRLAGQIISFSMQTLRALANSASLGLPYEELCKYRSAAISAKRSEVQAQRRLDALQKARRAGQLDQPICTLPRDVPALPEDAIVQIGLPLGLDLTPRRTPRKSKSVCRPRMPRRPLMPCRPWRLRQTPRCCRHPKLAPVRRRTQRRPCRPTELRCSCRRHRWR